MNYRGYEPSDEKAWLDFMALVQSKSDAWEALYLEKPKFHPKCDHLILDHHKNIVGIIAGHLIPHNEHIIYSVEILATSPHQQKKGLGKSLIIELSKNLGKGNLITFWTRTLSAKSWYEKIGLELIDSKHQFFHPLKRGNILNLVKETTEEQPPNLWCYAYICP